MNPKAELHVHLCPELKALHPWASCCNIGEDVEQVHEAEHLQTKMMVSKRVLPYGMVKLVPTGAGAIESIQRLNFMSELTEQLAA